MTTALRMAIELLGSQAALARCVAIRPQAVQQWTVKGRVPAARCLSVEQATRGRVSRYDLRPDVFGPAPLLTTNPNFKIRQTPRFRPRRASVADDHGA